MQVAVLPASIREQRPCHPQDCFLTIDANASATLMARLLVETASSQGYAETLGLKCGPPIFTSDAAEIAPGAAILSALREDEANGNGATPLVMAAQNGHAATAEALLRCGAAVDKAIASPVVVAAPPVVANVVQPPLRLAEVVEVVEVDARSHCCLDNCDRIFPNLYLGGMEAVMDSQRLADQGIHAVVCCNRELEYPTSKFFPELEYYRVDVEDMGREPIELFFPEATEFIRSQLLQERPVLVHCTAGVSRSASVLLAYMVEFCGYSLYDAFVQTLCHRPFITPNPGFMARLMDYEKEKCGIASSTICISKYIAWFQAGGERSLQPNLKPD